jgi:hypothetical protein
METFLNLLISLLHWIDERCWWSLLWTFFFVAVRWKHVYDYNKICVCLHIIIISPSKSFYSFSRSQKKKRVRERLFKKRLSSGCCVSIPENKAKNIKNNYKMIKYSPLQVYTIFFSKGIFPLRCCSSLQPCAVFYKKIKHTIYDKH